jgi:TonB-linked SusC/RagA family outer membrane protein
MSEYNAFNMYTSYSKIFNHKHNVKFMMGVNQEWLNFNRIVGEHGDLLYPDLSNFNLGTNVLTLSGSANNWAVRGFFGRINYNYRNRYLLEVNARQDGSSRFPLNSRWGIFPSVSAGWFISREEFWDSLFSGIDVFKFRLSYGKLGNQTIESYTFLQTLITSKTTWLFNGTRENLVSQPSPLPKSVTWEETKSVDIGLDMAFFKNKVTISFDWYDKRTDGMYVPGQPLPSVFGAPSPMQNIAGLRNRGIEISVGFVSKMDFLGSPLTLKGSFNIHNNVSTITKYPNPEGLMSTYWEGQKLGQIWGYRIDGQFQTDEEAKAYYQSFTNPAQQLGQVYSLIVNNPNVEWRTFRAGDIKYVDRDGDGEINRGKYTLEDHGDLEVIGNAMPQFPFGFSVNSSWKNFDLSLAGHGVVKQHWTPGGVTYWGHYDRPQASFIRKDLIDNAWDPENPGGRYPQIYRGYTALGDNRMLYSPNSYYLENVGFMRVKNLTFGYTLPQKIIKRFKMDSLRVYFSGENLFTWSFGGLTKYVDPEQAGSGIGYNNPADAFGRSMVEEYPYGKTYSFGISVLL